MPETRIGISGWRYDPWRGTFYPKDLPQRRELEYASRQLSSLEINGTFYSLQRPSSFRDWYAEVTQTPREVAEAALAHADGSKVERAYRRTDHLDQRRVLMERWARHVTGKGAVIVAFGRAE